MPYLEQIQDYKLVETTNGQEGVRSFVEDASGTTATLPTLGSLFDASSSHSWLRARRIEKTVFGKPNVYKYTVFYTTPNGSATQNPTDDTIVIGTKDFDNLQKTMQLGVDVLTVDVDPATDSNPAYKWNTTVNGSDTVKASVSRLIPSGAFIIPQKVTDLASFNGTAYPIAGRVNNATFLGFPAETVLFLGHNAHENFENDGSKNWIVEMQFQWKIIGMGASSKVYLGWNYFPRREYNSSATEVTEGFDKLLHRKTGNPVYPLADFELLIV